MDYAMDDDEFFESVPPGFQFCPRDDELIHYLSLKNNNERLPRNKIRVVEFYKFGPDTLAEMYKPSGKNKWHFFSKRETKYKNGSRPNRVAGDGYWRASGADKSIILRDKEIGFKKSLGYFRGKPGKSTKTDWLMTEFLLTKDNRAPVVQTQESNTKLDNWVLCVIYKKIVKEEGRNRKVIDETSNDSHATDQIMHDNITVPASTRVLDYGNMIPSLDNHQSGLFPGFGYEVTSAFQPSFSFPDNFSDIPMRFAPQIYSWLPSYIGVGSECIMGPTTFDSPPVDHCGVNCGPASGPEVIDELIRETLGPELGLMGDIDDVEWDSAIDEFLKGCCE